MTPGEPSIGEGPSLPVEPALASVDEDLRDRLGFLVEDAASQQRPRVHHEPQFAHAARWLDLLVLWGIALGLHREREALGPDIPKTKASVRAGETGLARPRKTAFLGNSCVGKGLARRVNDLPPDQQAGLHSHQSPARQKVRLGQAGRVVGARIQRESHAVTYPHVLRVNQVEPELGQIGRGMLTMPAALAVGLFAMVHPTHRGPLSSPGGRPGGTEESRSASPGWRTPPRSGPPHTPEGVQNHPYRFSLSLQYCQARGRIRHRRGEQQTSLGRGWWQVCEESKPSGQAGEGIERGEGWNWRLKEEKEAVTSGRRMGERSGAR